MNARFLSKTSVFCVLVGVCTFFFAFEKVVAQPGETRTFEEIEKHLQNALEEVNKNINEHQLRSEFYEGRGSVYYQLYENKVSRKGLSDEVYAQNGIADLTKAFELADKHYIPTARNAAKAKILAAWARLYEIIWQYQIYRIPEASVALRLKHFFESLNFKKAAADYQKATLLDSENKRYFGYLSNLYMLRCRQFLYAPKLLQEIRSQNKTGKLWRDFDLALEYAEKSREKRYSNWSEIEVLLKKGTISFEAERYDIALDAYLADKKYLGENYEYLCDETNGKSLCENDKKVIKYTFSFRRATIYVKTGKPEKALSEMETFFSNVFHRGCPEPFLLRATAYRQLGKTELAQADEKYAKELSPSSLNACSY